MAEACRLIRVFTADRSLEDYEADDLLRSAVERQFQVAGEALFQLNRNHPTIAARVEGYQRLIGLRHIRAHGYVAVRA